MRWLQQFTKPVSRPWRRWSTDHRPSDRRGAAVVELAILVPLLVFLFVVAVDFARIFYFSVILTDCARAGAMYASDPTVSAESAFASAEAAALADATNLNPLPTISTTSGFDESGRPYVEVTASHTFQTVTGFPGIPNQVNMSRKVRMIVSASSPEY